MMIFYPVIWNCHPPMAQKPRGSDSLLNQNFLKFVIDAAYGDRQPVFGLFVRDAPEHSPTLMRNAKCC
jgi:hypothetical protein